MSSLRIWLGSRVASMPIQATLHVTTEANVIVPSGAVSQVVRDSEDGSGIVEWVTPSKGDDVILASAGLVRVERQ